MDHLANQRPVFHSEADFQFAFAQAVSDLDDTIAIRLEVPRRGEKRTYVDLECRADQTSLIEFKYITRKWCWTDETTGETFDLRSHAALDLARLHFIHDVTRLEGWVGDDARVNGFAVLLTNDDRLWKEPTSSTATRDQAFRLHQGRILTGDLVWGTPDRPFPANDKPLRGTYRATWQPYAAPEDGATGGTLRWLGWSIP